MILDDLKFEVICKHFYDNVPKLYGDWQSLKPISFCEQRSDNYTFASLNGFVNITFKDSFILSYLYNYAFSNFKANNFFNSEPSFDDNFAGFCDNKYLKYLFTIYLKDLWKIKDLIDIQNISISETNLGIYRTLSVMLMYLIEKGSKQNEPFLNKKQYKKIYNIFLNKLNDALRHSSILNAPDILKLLTICAINIQVCQEA